MSQYQNAPGASQEAFDNLSEQIGTLFAYKVIVPYNRRASVTLTIPNDRGGKLLVVADAATRNYEGIYRSTSTGGVSLVELAKGSNITVSTGANSITITMNASSTFAVLELLVHGNGDISYS